MALTLFININELTDEQYSREMDFLCPHKRERVLKMRRPIFWDSRRTT